MLKEEENVGFIESGSPALSIEIFHIHVYIYMTITTNDHSPSRDALQDADSLTKTETPDC